MGINKNNIEGQLVADRIYELRVNPVKGNFDVSHLKEIHRRIFQDMEAAGLKGYNAGDYRPSVPSGKDWIKTRKLESINMRATVAYSRMDKNAQQLIEEILKDVSPKNLITLDRSDFTKEIGGLYSKLDYLHPFSEGNSRTLREFTRQLAEESNYKIDWKIYNQSEAGRDTLYIARDLSVNEIALPELVDISSKRYVYATQDIFLGNKNFTELLKDAI